MQPIIVKLNRICQISLIITNLQLNYPLDSDWYLFFLKDWSIEGYELLIVPVLPEKPVDDRKTVYEGDILSVRFVKSALAVNPCIVKIYNVCFSGFPFQTNFWFIYFIMKF